MWREKGELDVHSVEEVLLTFCFTGDTELLEAITPHSQVLQSRRRSKRKTSKGLHERFPRGKSLLLFRILPLIKANTSFRVATDCWISFHSFVHIPMNLIKLHSFSCLHIRLQCSAFLYSLRAIFTAAYSFIWSSKAFLASTNLSTTTSHRSMRSSKPFSSASTAVVPSMYAVSCVDIM